MGFADEIVVPSLLSLDKQTSHRTQTRHGKHFTFNYGTSVLKDKCAGGLDSGLGVINRSLDLPYYG